MSDFHSAFKKKLCMRTYRATPHYLIPGLNQQRALCSEHCSEHGTQHTLQCVGHKLFIPKTETPRLVVSGRDVATSLVSEKFKWQEKANALAVRYRKNPKANASLELLHGKVLAGVTDVTVSNLLARFVKHMSSDPDADFTGPYNWYYSEGTLSVVSLKKKPFVISVQGRYLDKICSVPLEENNGEWKPCLSSTITKCAPIRRKPIYQIKARNVKGRAVIGVRQRNAVAVYLNNACRRDLNLVQLHTYKICENERPLSGLDLDTSKPGHFCSSHSDRTIKVWDPTRRIPLLEGRAARNINCQKETGSSWCGVWYDKNDINQVVVADNCCVTWHDIRCRLSKSKGICLASTKHKLPLEWSCEEVSLLVPSQLHHQLYIGTTHSLLQVDKRWPTLVPQPVRRWTHMLNGHLLMGQTVPLQGTKSEIICVSCTQQAVVVLGGEICCSQHPPLCVTKACGNQGIVGLSFLPHPYLKRNDIITQTGSGDINSLCLKWDAGVVEKPEISDAKYHCKSSEATWTLGRGRQLHVTERCNMQPVYLGLQSARKRSLHRQHTSSLQKQPWQRSKADLMSYTDVLAPGILEAWGIDDMQEWSPTVTEPSAVDKVQQWLQMNSTSLNTVDGESEITAAESVSASRLRTADQAYLSGVLPASQFVEDEAENFDPITTHHRFSQSSSVRTRTVLPPYNNSTDFLDTSGDAYFHLSPNVVKQSKPSKNTSVKRKSQVLGF
ncbi:uncharacterized protein LOC126281234 [Schistocerca gregaria]|uniref:uncharacterized protein LOC126281234 n=1 Tax=Schistocerca gregaria TaxID=7010 RepID=UPI00211DD6BF|nr:uncharacterized protein LOC126281234 [Schistocerca gregaria]